jgi:hypothetical protein
MIQQHDPTSRNQHDEPVTNLPERKRFLDGELARRYSGD